MAHQNAWGLLKRTFSEYSEDRVPRLAAALAYYTIFAIAPLLIIAIAIAGFVFDEQAARGQVYTQLKGLWGEPAATLVQTMIQKASNIGTGIIATIIGIGLLLLGATGVFAELHDSLNTIWEVKPKHLGFWGVLRTRFVSFLMVLGIALLLIASLVASAVLAGMVGLLGKGMIGQVVNELVSLAVFTLLFAMIFKVLPDVNIRWSDVWIGAAATAVLFTVGKYLIGMYLGRGTLTGVFGAAGALVALLVWVYYSAQILFLGAEFTQVYARRHGQAIEPAETAEAVGEESMVVETSRPLPAAASAVMPEPSLYGVPSIPSGDGNGVQKPSKVRKAVPLLIGLAIGRMVLGGKKKKKPVRKVRTTEKHFSVARAVEPGWVTRERRATERARQLVERPLAFGERLAQRVSRGLRSARQKIASQS